MQSDCSQPLMSAQGATGLGLQLTKLALLLHRILTSFRQMEVHPGLLRQRLVWNFPQQQEGVQILHSQQGQVEATWRITWRTPAVIHLGSLPFRAVPQVEGPLLALCSPTPKTSGRGPKGLNLRRDWFTPPPTPTTFLLLSIPLLVRLAWNTKITVTNSC